MIRIEAFEGNKAPVYGQTTRGDMALAGWLIKGGEQIMFRRSTNIRGISGLLASREFQAELKKVREALAVELKKTMHAESEFYIEVKEALMAEGKAEHVAANLINTEPKLMAEARRTGVI